MDERKTQYLIDVLQDEKLARSIIDRAKKGSEAIKALGVAYKDFIPVTDLENEVKAEQEQKDAPQQADKGVDALKALVPGLYESFGELAQSLDATEKGLKATIEQQAKAIADLTTRLTAAEKALAVTPVASSKDSGTTIPTDKAASAEAEYQKKQTPDNRPFGGLGLYADEEPVS